MNGYEISWDGVIENDSPEFILLPEGEYNFEVINFERGRHPGSEKLPPCNKATLHLRISGDEGTTVIKHNLFLHSITEGLLCSFFTAIGQRKKGERITMNWNKVIGATGRVKIGIRRWTNDEGKEISVNEVKKFLEPDVESETTQKSGNVKFQPGRF